MVGNSRVTGVAAFLAVGLLGGGAALPTVAAAEPASTRGQNCVAARLAEVRAIAELTGTTDPGTTVPPTFKDNWIKQFHDSAEKPC